VMESETMRILVEVSSMKEKGQVQTDVMKKEAAIHLDRRYMWFSQRKLTVYSEQGNTGLKTENGFFAGGRQMEINCEKSIGWRNPLHLLRTAKKLKRMKMSERNEGQR